MTFEWRVPIDQMLFGLTYAEDITDETVEWNAESAIHFTTLDLGPEVYYRAIDQALASGEDLDGLRQLPQFGQEQVAGFLRAVATRLDELRPWPVPKVRPLDATTWASFGGAVPIARLDASIVGLTDVLQKGFRPVGDSPSGPNVLMLKLQTGETIALLGSYGRGEKVTLLADAESDPTAVIEHFTESTGFPADKVGPVQGRT
jgi:hypothetical protein